MIVMLLLNSKSENAFVLTRLKKVEDDDENRRSICISIIRQRCTRNKGKEINSTNEKIIIPRGTFTFGVHVSLFSFIKLGIDVNFKEYTVLRQRCRV